MKSGIASRLALDPDNLRPSLLTLILRVSVALGLVVCVPSVYFALKLHLVAVAVGDIIAISAIILLLVLTRIPFRARAIAVCLVYYMLGAGLLMGVGSISQIYLFGFSVVTVLLLGLRLGLYAALLSALTLLAIGLRGYAAPEMTLPGWHSQVAEWIVITLNFALVNTLLTLAVGAVLTTVHKAFKREIDQRLSLRTLIDTLPDVVFTKDAGGRYVICNPATVKLFGRAREDEVAGKTVFDIYPQKLAAGYHEEDQRVMAGIPQINREHEDLDDEGHPRWRLTTRVPLRDATGVTTGIIAISRDITERKLANAERRRLLAQLQLQIERMPLAYLLSDRDLGYTRWNPAAERIFGFRESEVLGKHPFEVIVPPASQPMVGQIFDKLKAGSMDAHGECENRTKTGATIICEWHNTPMFDESGAFVGLLSLAQDVTNRKKLEEQLRQGQKMEAVGQLAGGIAHDFNNLLSVILSYADLLLGEEIADEPMREDLGEIRQAAMRASDLTRQLLMFSRKQVVAPKTLDLNQLLAGIDKMLRRLLGEDVELTSLRSGVPALVRADPGSIEQVILNLAINARDAMPVGGKLTMETALVTLDEDYAKTHLGAVPGPYVMLSVTDTGTGMDKATLAHIFEPFFTTKEQGKGTGLGLSTVFGIVQQSGGSVWVYSEPGMGSTFKVYLPRVDALTAGAQAAVVPALLRGSETILLVEDEDQVRVVAGDILRRFGYTVHEARSPAEAFQLCARLGPIQLLLSDVVMPQMSGPALALELTQSRPEMRVLCMSGYTDDAAVRHGVIDAKLAYLQKPLTVETLTRRVREVLDAKSP